MPINRQEAEWRKVIPWPAPLAAVKYGFESKTDSSIQTALGQTPITVADLQNLIIKPNGCRPAVATKKGTVATGSKSGFCGNSVIPTLTATGYRIKRAKPPLIRRAKGENKSLKVTINGIDYGWIRAKDTLYSALNNHGHATPTTNDYNKVIYGCNFPKPPTVGVVDTSGKTVSSLCDPSKLEALLQAGGFLVDRGSYTETDLLVIIGGTAEP